MGTLATFVSEGILLKKKKSDSCQALALGYNLTEFAF